MYPVKRMNYIDLFAGAGGLSEGFARAGFTPIAHIEMVRNACDTLLTRSFYYKLKKTTKGRKYYSSYLRGEITHEEFFKSMPKDILDSVICETMSKDSLPKIFDKIDQRALALNINQVDIIIGGPPCQAYSLVGRSRKDMNSDPRNWLYKLYIEFLKKYKPKLFVFENVEGIKTAGGGSFLEDIKRLVGKAGYDMDIRLLESQNYGVLQRRKREIIIGVQKSYHKSHPDYPYPEADFNSDKYFVKDLLVDLPPLQPGEKNNQYVDKPTRYLSESCIRQKSDILTWHETRPIREHDRKIYRFVIEFTSKWGRNPKYTEIPSELRTHKNQSSFLDRFKVVRSDAHYSQTMVAHISKDGHYYIHPDIKQARSLSVREAARIQSFPDNYFFEGPRTSALTQIGNAVPPLLAYKIAKAIQEYLSNLS